MSMKYKRLISQGMRKTHREKCMILIGTGGHILGDVNVCLGRGPVFS